MWGFLIHLIVAEFVGVEVSLGSSEVHRNLGIVWGVLWLLALGGYITFQHFFNEEVCIKVNSPQGDLSTYLIQTTYSRISELVEHVIKNKLPKGAITDSLQEKKEELVKTLANYYIGRIIMNVFLIGLWINAIVVFVLIIKCKERGQCQY